MSPVLCVQPGFGLSGKAYLPGDKSLSHRLALFAALATGESRISGFLSAGVTHALLNSIELLGVKTHFEQDTLIVQSPGYRNFTPPRTPLDCGNSATTMRLLTGALAAANIPAILDGSEGLRLRPMERIVKPLQQMGVVIHAKDGCAPLVIEKSSHPLKNISYELPVASAQVKSCLLLSALAAKGETRLIEPGPSRDHTERLMNSMGVNVESHVLPNSSHTPIQYITRLVPPQGWGSVWDFAPIQIDIPGDISSAAFLIVATLITPGSNLILENVGLNPTRTGLLDVLQEMGADLIVNSTGEAGGEPVGSIIVRSSSLSATTISGPVVVRMIDEFPALAVAAAFAKGKTTVLDAYELRHKESDRIKTMCSGLQQCGINAVETVDGFIIEGDPMFHHDKSTLNTPLLLHPQGDHRLAMSFTLLGLNGRQPVNISHAEIINESFPEFVNILQGLGARMTWESG